MKLNNLILILSITFLRSICLGQGCFDKKDSFEYFYINGILAGANNYSTYEGNQSSYLIKQKFNIKSNITHISNDTYGLFKDIAQVFSQVSLEQLIKLSYRKKEILLEQQDSVIGDSKKYLEYLNTNKNNIIFAHSQGNLFTNTMCDIKDNSLSMEVISVAPPTEVLKCNIHQTYALYRDDLVVNLLSSKEEIKNINKPKELKRHRLAYTHQLSWTKFFKLNHTLSEYLNNDTVVSDLNKGLRLTESDIYKNQIKEIIYTFKIDEKSLIQKTKDSLNQLSNNTDMWLREKKAFLNTLEYGRKIASSSLSSGKISDSLNQILETPIPATNEQEFIDMIAYSIKNLSFYCNNKKFNQRIKKICSAFNDRDYFKSKDIEDTYFPSLEAYGFKDQKLLLNCESIMAFYNTNGSQNKISLVLNYYPNNKPKVSFNTNDLVLTYPEEKKDIESNLLIKINMGTLIFDQNKKTKEYTLDYRHLNQHVAQTHTELERNTISLNQDDFIKCNTLNKLGSKECDYLVNKITQKYLTN